jgi:hypothetical protein
VRQLNQGWQEVGFLGFWVFAKKNQIMKILLKKIGRILIGVVKHGSKIADFDQIFQLSQLVSCTWPILSIF